MQATSVPQSPSIPHTPSRDQGTHPYAIVTTSTALLTRSNSTNAKLPNHSYSPTPLPSLHSSPSHRHDYRRHRHSRSLNSLPFSPPSLPAPPPSPHQRCTLSDVELSSDSGSEYGNELQESSSIVTSENPKLWNTEQLSSYLCQLNLTVLGDFVNNQKISGAEFLRLSTTTIPPLFADILSQEQLPILYEQSRKLRLLSLKSRFHIPESSVNDSPRKWCNLASPDGGKVKGMIKAFEEQGFSLPQPRSRSGSSSSSGSFSLPFHQDTRVSRYLGEEEQFASGSEPESDNEVMVYRPSLYSADASENKFFSGYGSPPDTSLGINRPFLSASDKLPLSSALTQVDTVSTCEEPSVETLLLLNEESSQPLVTPTTLWGAKAWEDDVYGATAKRIPFSPDASDQQVNEFGVSIRQKIRVSDHEGSVIVDDDSKQLKFEVDIQTPPVVPETPEPSDNVEQLKARLAKLEARIKDLEESPSTYNTSGNEQAAPLPLNEVPTLDMELPQYLLMAGVGVCAIIGQAVLRKIAGMRA